MTPAAQEQTSQLPSLGRGAMWFALLGGGVAWAVHLGGAWAISEFGCIAGVQRHVVLGVSAVAWAILALSVVMLAMAVAATVVGWRGENRVDMLDPNDRVAGSAIYMARAGWITSGVFTFIILIESIPILFYLGDC